MEAKTIYHNLKAIAEPIHAYGDQLAAFAKWIESEFEYKPNKKPVSNEFRNENRNRYYGLRVGDIINAKSISGTIWGRSEVLDLMPMDNNAVVIESKNGEPIKWVAEWCDIVVKVEDRPKLIDAAPDLLKALQNIVEYWNTPQEGSMKQHFDYMMDVAEKAIKKANL